MMCDEAMRPLTFETMLNDPMVRLMMQADRVSVAEFVAVMQIARAQMVERERLALSRATEDPGAAARPD
jgi:hypothetical protein